MLFYDKKRTASPLPIPITFSGAPLEKVSYTAIALGPIINEDISFTPHIESIPKICKQAYSRLTLFPDIRPDLAVQLYKSFIWSKLEKKNHPLGTYIW